MTQPSRSLVVLVTGALVAVGTPVLAAPPEPSSAQDLAESRQTVRDKEERIEQVTARLKQAKVELAKLGDRVELAQKRYNEETAKLERTRKAFTEARQQVRTADAKYETAQAEAAQTETAQAGAARAENVHADEAQTENAHVEEAQGENAPAEDAGTEEGEEGESTPSAERSRKPEKPAVEGTEGSQMDVAAFLAGMMPGAPSGGEARLEQLEAEKTDTRTARAEARRAYDLQQQAVSAALTAKKEAEEAYEKQKATVSRLLALRKRLTTELGRSENKVIFLADRRRRVLRGANSATEPQVVINKSKKGEQRQFARGAARGRQVVQSALKWIGTPYSWGGGDPSGPSYGIGRGSRTRGFDCSGLALYAWAQAGVKLDHFTGSQWNSGPRIPLGMLNPGDLVFFARNTKDPDTIHHVGIFIGRGRMVEAPYTGARVRISSIWRRGLIGAVRPA